ncbi:MAG: hypothetical protein A2527_14150 [Candidatus Lambdaproteobacteria bacterium RIFOXYD2_FULL_50_16]|uniref:Uncharacterized protein n=1 Tax=Candidatus Lambdaproteobacteria bacterium RIFOXYD2_FULL_50_16 TaxID=1817772 RepID=A0A1F6G4M6_9PROT|nr:MAG: hypothetical protein A2527_14150 [Candidatus Lambdaproteobacteria bacterium RIFOXYD2_FULL_50_16]
MTSDHDEINRTLGRVQGLLESLDAGQRSHQAKLDQIISAQGRVFESARNIAEIKGTLDKHGDRLGKLENWQSVAKVRLSLLAAGISSGAAYFVKFFTHPGG